LNGIDAVTDLLSVDFGGPNAGGAFYAGPENRAAVSVVEQFFAADDAAQLPSPLIWYGPSLSGKTYLARNMAAFWQQQRPDAKVLFLTGADYAREFSDACRASTVDHFSARVRRCDLLVVDALDEMLGKVAAQEHCCRTLDQLRVRESTCIITMRHPCGKPRTTFAGDLLPGLASRLSAGLSVAVAPPAEATRAQLAELFAARFDVALEEEATRLLAQRLPASVPAVANAVAQLAKRQTDLVTSACVQQWLSEQDSPAPLTLRTIAAAAAKLTGATLGQLRSPSRRTTHVRARGIAMLAARKLTSTSLGAIGREFGGRDHTTVMHACRKTEALLESDRELALLWNELISSLKEYESEEHRSSSDAKEETANHDAAGRNTGGQGENLSFTCASRS